tara:strand:- start:59 stop:673 length:615 start_codon:yes stop_codon:yes gene_type:complete
MIGNYTTLEGDSLDYDLLYRAAQKSKDIDGLVCEIGTRKGGSLAYIIDALQHTNKHIIAIDPYGNIEYQSTEHDFVRLDYTNDMKHEAMMNIHAYVRNKGVNFTFFNLEDTEFFKRYDDGVPVYNQHKQVLNTYSFVFYDGPHDVTSIMDELFFFMSRSVSGTVYVFDDILSYPHNEIDAYLLNNGFALLEQGAQQRKASYIKQ